VKTVIFDFDGTLADTVELAVRIYNQLSSQFKTEPLKVSEIPTLIKMGYYKAAKSKKIRWLIIPKLIFTASREMRRHMDEVKPYAGIVEAIAKLKAEGYTVGVLTSNQEELVNEFFEANKFPVFDFVTSEKSIFGKHKALKKIIQARAVEREEVIYVGDEPRDLTASRKAGVKFLGVSWGVASRDSFGGDPDLVIDSPNQLLSAAKELVG
jgi:phosphoglycolate phosphatase